MRRIALLLLAVFAGCEGDPNDAKTWIKKLDDLNEQKEAVRQLVKLKDKQAVPPLIELYKKTHNPEHLKAVASIGDPSAVPVLIEALDYTEESFEAASVAATALGELGDHSAETVAALSKAALKPLPVKSRANVARADALKALDRLKDPKAVDALIQVLSRTADEQDFFLNKLAARALADAPNPKAVPVLVRGLFMTGRNTDIFQPCRAALVGIGEPAIDKLIETFQRKNAEIEEDAKRYEFLPGIVVQKASILLGDLGARKAVPMLLEELKKKDEGLAAGPGQGVSGHQSILLALGAIGDPAAVKPLSAILADGKRSSKHRVAAAEALNLIGDPAALPALASTAKLKWLSGTTIDPDLAGIAAAAITAYSRLAGPSAPALALPKIDPELADMYDVVKNAEERMALAKECGADAACYGKAFTGGKPVRAEKAAFMLARMGKPALPYLTKPLGHADPAVRLAVLFAIARVADGSTAEVKKALDDQIANDETKPLLRGVVDEMRVVRARLGR